MPIGRIIFAVKLKLSDSLLSSLITKPAYLNVHKQIR